MITSDSVLCFTHYLLREVVLGPRRVEEALAVAPLEEDDADGPRRVLHLVVEEQVLFKGKEMR